MTVTIAKYLTPNGKDIHKDGIYPDVKYEPSEKDLENFTRDDLATIKDKQYIVAETQLVKTLRKAQKGTTFKSDNFKINHSLID